MAADGQWYPPDAEPGASAQAPLPLAVMPESTVNPFAARTVVDPGAPLPPFSSGAPAPATAPAGTAQPAAGSGWSEVDDFTRAELFAAPDYHRQLLADAPAEYDTRGLACAAASAAVVFFTFLHWYVVQGTLRSSHLMAERSMTVYSATYRSWYVLIPVVAGLGVAVGLANFFLRPGDRGATGVFVLLRVAEIATLVLVLVAFFNDKPPDLSHLHYQAATVQTLWPLYAAAAAAIVGVLASLASAPPLRD